MKNTLHVHVFDIDCDYAAIATVEILMLPSIGHEMMINADGRGLGRYRVESIMWVQAETTTFLAPQIIVRIV